LAAGSQSPRASGGVGGRLSRVWAAVGAAGPLLLVVPLCWPLAAGREADRLKTAKPGTATNNRRPAASNTKAR